MSAMIIVNGRSMSGWRGGRCIECSSRCRQLAEKRTLTGGVRLVRFAPACMPARW